MIDEDRQATIDTDQNNPLLNYVKTTVVSGTNDTLIFALKSTNFKTRLSIKTLPKVGSLFLEHQALVDCPYFSQW